jgi:outer membrane protein assembly factor BamE (lipoprotein component of BamABCDE complex)
MSLSVRTLGAAALLAALGTAACTPVRTHQGYVVDHDLVASVQPGIDTRQSVLQTLGQPSFTSQFNEGDWYYVSRDNSNFMFQDPRPKQQMTLRVRFDQAGNVTAIDQTGTELVASISPYGKTTPTLGRHSNFFQDLFGNIGTVGAAGMGGGGGGGSNTGP